MNALWSFLSWFFSKKDPCPEILEAAVENWAKLNAALVARVEMLELRLAVAEARTLELEAERTVLLNRIDHLQKEIIRLAR